MELDEKSVQGHWAENIKKDMEFFIINDAIFSKLCILGDDVEPCFEGASITAPNISKNFSLDENFKQSLYSMMKELQDTLQGGKYTVADEIKKKSVDSSTVIEETAIEVEEPQENVTETPAAGTETPSSDNTEASEVADAGSDNAESAGEASDAGADAGDGSADGGSGSTDYVKKEEDKEEKQDDKEDSKEDSKDSDEKEKEDDEDKKKEDKYALVAAELEELQNKYSALQEEHQIALDEIKALRDYKLNKETEQKDALIAEFYMLSDEDKKDVINHKAEYSLDDIKSKLAVLCYDKKVSYVKDEETNSNMTVNINTYSADIPDWLQAVEEHRSQQ